MRKACSSNLNFNVSVSLATPSSTVFTSVGFISENSNIGDALESIAFSFTGKSIGDCSFPSEQSHSQSVP